MGKALRVLKFDSVHPLSYLATKLRDAADELRALSFEQHIDWLMGLRAGLSDYLTHPMNEAGWVAREVVAQDGMLCRKMPGAAGGWGEKLRARAAEIANAPFRDVVALRAFRDKPSRTKEKALAAYTDYFRPDVLFIREPCHVDGKFWDRYRDKCVIASFIACNTDHAINWDEHRSDVIFTLTPEYERFFKVQGIESHILEYGVDERVGREVAGVDKEHDCSFVGYLGTPSQTRKTELMNAVAREVDFKWWGVKGPELAKYPALERTWQGETAGIDMLRIYKGSRIVLNDYVDMAAGTNVNMRTKEVMSVGSMLLTRRAANIETLEGEGALVTFGDAEECIAKIRHYLAHDDQREAVAAKGLQVALRDFNYRDITSKLMRVFEAKVQQCGRRWN